MRLLPAVLFIVATSWLASGQTFTISTLAGGYLPENIPGTSTSLYSPSSVAVDKTGNIFIGDANGQVVLRLDATTGLVTVVAGNGSAGFSGDNGPATSAQLYQPQGVAVDSAGDLYIADSYNSRVRKVSNGVITTVAGNGAYFGVSGDNGPATSAFLNYPNGVAVDAAGNLYIADTGNSSIRKVANGVITTVAGNGTAGFSGDNGLATNAQLSHPEAVAVDSAGNLYIVESFNERVRKVSDGVITTIAGNGNFGFSGDNGPATSAQLANPSGVAVDSAGNVYIADTYNARVREVANGVITTVAGIGCCGFSGDNGPATSRGPTGVAVDAGGNLYIADAYFNYRVRKVANGVITTVVGNGLVGDNGPAAGSLLNNPVGVAVDSAGNVYIADTDNERIRKVANGVITTVTGNGVPLVSYDNGPAAGAPVVDPAGIAVDSAGNIYIADLYRIREVSNGVIATVAGNGMEGFSGDNGPATSAQMGQPVGIAVDAAGNLYIADQGNNRIRKVSGRVIATVAGNGTAGFSGDGGPATAAQLSNPAGIAVDSAGNLYIADSYNQRIRKVSGGVITTVAGSGTFGLIGDNGPATSAWLNFPQGVAVDAAGNLYIADTYNNRIRRVSNGVITTVAGNGTPALSGDNGPAASAALNQPQGIAVDSADNLYFADTNDNRIRLLTPVGLPSINAGGTVNAASSAAGSPVAPGSIATVYGSFLVSSLSTASSSPLPVSLAGLSLQFGSGLTAPLFAVSSGQVNFQVPWELAGESKTSLSATWNGQPSATQTLNLAPFAPGIFSMNGQGTGQGAILDTSYSLVNSSNPATAGSTILQIYCTGLGAVTNQPPSGSPPPTNLLSQTTTTPTVTIGGVQAQVLFAGLAPGSVGEYQVDALVPASSSKGAAVPVVIAIGGTTSNVVTIAVQ
jgi:uncharacterized protein (TIGR03437 family)